MKELSVKYESAKRESIDSDDQSVHDLVKRSATRSTEIQLLVVNDSVKTVAAGGRWGVKDEDANPPAIAEAVFGRIRPGQQQERFVYLPSGVEWGIFRFEAEGGGEWVAPHGGDDTVAYKLTLGD